MATDNGLLIAITLLAAAVRFATVGVQSYWLDESQAAHEVTLSLGGMLSSWNHYEGNPPLYFLLAWPWSRVFGTGEAGLRSLSVLMGVALVPVVYLCGRELVSRRAGLLAAAFTAVNPFMIWYSQEAREYMLLGLTSAVSLLLFARARRVPTRRALWWWGLAAALALLSQYFAGFLIVAEGVALVLRARSRTSVVVLLLLGALELALIPHVAPLLSGSPQFVTSLPLSLRLQQVPVTFAAETLYQTGVVSYGLLAAAVLAAALIALLIAGADERELRGAGLAAAMAAAVLLIPLVLALAGHDDYIPRVLIPGWAPLIVVIAAACTAAHARLAGAAVAVALLGVFVYAQIRIVSDPGLQKSDWRGVAAALGQARVRRAVVANDGVFATAPLSLYLPRVPWSGPGMGPPPATATVSELDIVGSTDQQLAKLPPGVRLISSQVVHGYRVVRFALATPVTTSPTDIAARAAALLGPGPPAPTVLIQQAAPARAVS
jgi:uncharacterized membrane protein